MTARGLEVATREGGRVGVTSERLEALGSRLEGRLLSAGDDAWSEAVRIWNGRAATLPSLVVQPVTVADVAAAVNFAREHRLLLGIKGGGHNIAGTAIAEGGLTLDMSRMREVTVDPGAKLAHVGPGCRLRDVDRATQAHGLATVLGFVSKTGVAGLTLGGGFGYLTRRFGWTADNLASVQIVTADGSLRTANAEEHHDLFWAVRGGGGNFGVVTRFSLRIHEVGPNVTGGLMLWGAERIEEVLAAYRNLTANAPRTLTAALVVLTAPPAPFIPAEWHGRPAVGLLICHSGADAEADLEPIRALGSPIVDLVGPKPYVAIQSLLDDSPSEADGLHQYWKTELLPGISPDYLAVFGERALGATSPLSFSVVFHIGGALNERAEDDGAVGNRDARYISGFSGVWTPSDSRADEHVAWVKESWTAIRPFSTGGNYVNFQLADDDGDRTAAAYGKNYERLQRVKGTYDPDNLFRVNRNIPPRATSA